ncbi:hypothetical protein ACP4J4_04540 [Aureimonas ureilytica]|uniref:hypothetical protein n=1 Tax=Aureimonas ureilytica TaxID=401562 RepID=UPI003CF8FBC5
MLFALTLVSALLGTPEASPPQPPSRAEPTGAETPVIESLCVSAERPEAGGEALRCAGLPGFDLLLAGPSDRRRVAIGRPEGFLPAPPEPMRLGSTARWRLDGTRPLAVILRYRLASVPDEILWVVVKAPVGETPGCLAAILAGRAGAGGEEADAFADGRAAAFRCGVDRPAFLGPRPDPALQRAGLAWVSEP